MNVSELTAEPGAPDFHQRFVLLLKRVLARPPEAGVVNTVADLPKTPRQGALVWVRSINRMAAFIDGGWLRTDTGVAP